MSNDLPDSVFPNNWFSTHKNEDFKDGVFFVYPMKALTRQKEVNPEIIKEIGFKNYCTIHKLNPFDSSESLEGTGSLVFDN